VVAATLGVVEGGREDDAERNRLCPPLTFTGRISDVLELSHVGMSPSEPPDSLV
jgi:hypothetical protein